MNIAVLVSGGGTNLQALIDASDNGEFQGLRLALCLSSNPDAYALVRAKEADIPCMIVARSDYASRTDYTKALIKALLPFDIDLVVLAGFMVILSPEFFQSYANKVINVHPSLIPSFCGDGFYGLTVHKAALDYGVKVSGASVHIVTAETDAGPLILQKAVPVLDTDTPQTLQKRIMEQAEWPLLVKAVKLFCQGRLEIVGRHVKINT